MTIVISSWFNEPGVTFEISYKVHNLIRQGLADNIMKPFGLDEKDPNFLMRLVTATSISTTELEVRGPEYNKRNKFLSFGLWLPYEKIHNSENYLKEYLYYYFEALVIVFKKYDIPELPIRKLQDKVEAEVINNEMYAYRE